MKRCNAIAVVACSLAACSATIDPKLPLKLAADVPLSGNSTRFDYESLDARSGILYIAHMGDGAVVAFDTRARKLVATVANVPTVRGVLAVPQLHRVFAAAEGSGEVVVIDERLRRIAARVTAGNVDGLAYDPETSRVFVSDEAGARDVVIDAVHDRIVAAIALGGEAGNTVYDQNSHHIFVAVQTLNQLAEIDPQRLRIVRRDSLPGCEHSHGIALDERTHFAYVAGEANSSVVAFDMRKKKVIAKSSVGDGVDVLAIDESLGRLYVASESGVVTVFDVANRHFRKLGQSWLAPNAHVVLADPKTHLVYFPLRDLNGKPMLRIMSPVI